MAVRRAHHGNLDALIAQSSDTSGPFSFDRGPPFELKAELAIEINRPSEVLDDDSYVSIRLSAMCPIYKVSSIIARFAGRVNLLQIESKLAASAQKQLRRIVPRCDMLLPIGDGGRVWQAITRRQTLVEGHRIRQFRSTSLALSRDLLKTVQQEVYSSLSCSSPARACRE